MKRLAILLLVTPLMVPAAAAAAGGSSAGTADTAIDTPAQAPEELAVEYYNRGLKLRDKAWELEEKAEGSDKAEALLKKADKQWKKAANAFEEAIANNPLLHQAHSSLGYAYRKLGRYEDSLGAYDRALELAPGYVEAIEYRAEAYLGLDRLEAAKDAYLELFRLDREQAETLMTAMREWIETRREDAGSVTSEAVEAFSQWVEERSEIASQVSMLTQSQGRSW